MLPRKKVQQVLVSLNGCLHQDELLKQIDSWFPQKMWFFSVSLCVGLWTILHACLKCVRVWLESQSEIRKDQMWLLLSPAFSCKLGDSPNVQNSLYIPVLKPYWPFEPKTTNSNNTKPFIFSPFGTLSHPSHYRHFGNTQTHARCCFSPINNWLLSCRWICPSAGASCLATGNSSTRNDASFTFRSARTLCHRLSFSGTLVSTRTSSGPFPTSKEKTTSEEAGEGGNI